MAIGAAIGATAAKAGAMGLKAAAAKGGAALGANTLGQSALLAGGGTAIGALPDIIPSKYEREQRKRLRELQRKQEMGALGLTERERAQIESQMRGARQQAQQYAEAERARLTQPTAQPQMALLGQQMQDESRQRLEADLASQVLGMDLARQAQQEQEIRALEAAQADYRRRRFEGLTAPFQSAAESYVGQLGLERMLSGASPEQRQRYFDMQFMQRLGQGAQSMGQGVQRMFMRPLESYTYEDMRGMGLSDQEIADYFARTGQSKIIPNLNIPGDALDGTRFGIYGGERGY